MYVTSLCWFIYFSFFAHHISSMLSVQKNIDLLLVSVQRGDVAKIRESVENITKLGQKKLLARLDSEHETILHRAVKMRARCEVLECLIDLCPELLCESRQNSALYRGQSVLHIAITGNDVIIAEMLLQKLSREANFDKILGACATGSKFENTVMLGEFPLAVASLTLNIDMFDKIKQYGGCLNSQNSKGDTLFHCLIKYAYLYPEKIADVVKMYEHAAAKASENKNSAENVEVDISSEGGLSSMQSCTRVWKVTNKDGLNPLKLAAKLGQHAIFKITMEMKGVYCFVNSEDGLFDVELYDVTDIDSLSDFNLMNSISKGFSAVFDETGQTEKDLAPVTHVPTLEMIIDNDPAVVFKFIEMSPLRYVINRKWAYYRWFFLIWGCLHMLYTTGFTFYTVRRSEVIRHSNSTIIFQTSIGSDTYVTFYAILSIIIAALYLIQEIVRIFKGRMPWTLSHLHNCYHTGPFRLIIAVFAVTTITDVIWRVSDTTYEDYFLVMAMILSWWFLVFFLRGFRQFSFFTVMIQKVLVGDMFRFSIIISMELIAFTTAMFVAFRGQQTTDENVTEYSKFMVLSFKMMFGFTSLDVLFEAPNPWFAICLYVAFVLLTYVLMINSLIAMMSNTCSVVSQNREIQYRVQQLSIVLFFESILPLNLLRIVGQKRVCGISDPESRMAKKEARIFMEVRSLHEVTKSRSRHRPNPETMLETIFHTIKSIPLPSFASTEPEKPEKDINEASVRAAGRQPLQSTPENQNEDDSYVPRSRKHKKKKRRRENEGNAPVPSMRPQSPFDANLATQNRDEDMLTNVENT